MNELRKAIGWRVARLGELGTYVNGRGFRPEEWTTSGLPIIRIENLNDASAPCNHFAGKLEDRYRADTGDLLVSWSATLDVFWWDRGPAAVNQHIFKVTERSGLSRRFLYFLLKSVIEQLRHQVHGSTMKHVTKPKFEALEVLVPTDSSGRYALLEKLESELALAEEAQRWIGEQRAATSALVETIVDSQLRSDVEVGKLGDVLAAKARSGWSPVCDDNPDGTPVLTLSSVTHFTYRPAAFKRTSEDTDPEAHYWVKDGDLFISRSNTPALVGHAALATKPLEPTIYSDLLMRLDVDSSKAYKPFVHLWLMGRTARAHVRGQARSSSGTMKKINQSIIDAIPFPSALRLAEQKRLVTLMSSQIEAARNAVDCTEAAAADAEAISASIIRDAFTVRNLESVDD